MTGATGSHRRGVTLCLLSAVGFGLMALFAKEAYRHDVSVLTLLALRFTLAAGAFWAITIARGPARRGPRPSRSLVLAGLAMGAVGYAAQSGGYFGALTRMDASLTSLLMYVYPVLVFAGAVLIGRERADAARIKALVLALAGVSLVLASGGTGGLDPLGLALAMGGALTYATYILVADRVVARVDGFLLCALISTGAAATLWTAGLATGSLRLRFDAGGWAWVAALAGISTVFAISAFLRGLPHVGPATASIVSTIEPLVTVATAMLAFGEHLAAPQIAGGALVLSAVVLLQVKVRPRVASPEPALPATARAAA